MGANIYATTKLIRKGSSTPLKRRINTYSATNTSTVMMLRTTHLRSRIDEVSLGVVSVGILNGRSMVFELPKFCGAKVVKKNEICKFYVKYIKYVKKTLFFLAHLCFFYYLCTLFNK